MNALQKTLRWIEERTGIAGTLAPLAYHRVPPDSKWLYVFGSATLAAFVVQVVTGVALATVYVPSSGQAYDSLTYIAGQAPYGSVLRGIHYFGASAMVLFVGVHLIRVYLMAAFKYPRELTWLTGLLLLALTLGMGFTGQLLRWDQNAVWSVIVGAEQAARMPLVGKTLVKLVLSGPTVGGATLSHFFVLHVLVIPGLLFAGIGQHLFLVLRHGISEPPVAGRPVDRATYRSWYEAMLERVGHPFWPYSAWRDVVFAVLMIAAVVVLAVVVGAPAVGKPPDPSIVEAQPRPDWYLLWYFAVLALLPHGAESYVIVLAPLFGAVTLAAVPFLSRGGERHWRRRPWAPVTVMAIVAFVGVLWHAGVQAKWAPAFHATPIPDNVVGVTSGLVHDGAVVFNTKGCLYCHTVSGYGGTRGPNLSDVGSRLTKDEMMIRVLNGGYNMPAYADSLTPQQAESAVEFLSSRGSPPPKR